MASRLSGRPENQKLKEYTGDSLGGIRYPWHQGWPRNPAYITLRSPFINFFLNGYSYKFTMI